MELLKYTLMGLIVTRLSAASAADPLKQNLRADEVKPDVIPIFFYAREGSLDGDYKFKYETGNGIFAEEHGVMTNKGTENEANSVVGAYRYTSPEGVPIEVTYTAGVDGFKAYGAHLPVVGPSAHAAQTAPARFAGPQFRAGISGAASGGDVPTEQPRPGPSPQPLQLLPRQTPAPQQRVVAPKAEMDRLERPSTQQIPHSESSVVLPVDNKPAENKPFVPQQSVIPSALTQNYISQYYPASPPPEELRAFSAVRSVPAPGAWQYPAWTQNQRINAGRPQVPRQFPATASTPAAAAGQNQWFNAGRPLQVSRQYPASAWTDVAPLSQIVLEPQRVLYVPPRNPLPNSAPRVTIPEPPRY